MTDRAIPPRAPESALDEPAPVRGDERLDGDKLRAFLAAKLETGEAPIEVLQFPKGHSNLTYLVRAGEREWVLRRAPHGAAIKTAHDMQREHTILSALAPVYPLAPRPAAFCDDESVLGARFYLMQRVRGVVLRGNRLPKGLEVAPDTVHEISCALVDGLADLHAVDYRAAGLGALGHPEGYVARQVKGWTERYLRAKTDEVESVERAAAWLAANQPGERGAALVHNDYKYDNVVLAPADLRRMVAVLDWEMATVGDPLMDVGTSLGYWVDPDDPPEMLAMPLGPTALPGNLSRRAVWERYRARSRAGEVDPLFYYVFGLFKIAVIAQQIYQRFAAGLTKDPRFAALIVGVRILGEQARRALERGRIDALG